MEFDPLDDMWWQAGTELNWWDSTLAGMPKWALDETEADGYIRRNRRSALTALALIHSYRTVTSLQMHELDGTMPLQARSRLYMALAGLRLVDVGFPRFVDGRAPFNPHSSPYTAFRLPNHTDIRPRLARLGFNPIEINAIGPGVLRGDRQYSRHNLIATGLAVAARRRGWDTRGEAWGDFRLLSGLGDDGGRRVPHGSADLTLIGEHGLVCIELTASTNQQLAGKFDRWTRMLQADRLRDAHVVWVAAGMGDPGILRSLTAACRDRVRQHAADVRVWRDTFAAEDGWHPEPGRLPEREDWMDAVMRDVGERVGLRNAWRWRRPERLNGLWLG